MAIKKYLNPEKLKEVQIFLKHMQAAGISFRKVILFGSFARGIAKPWSDIDICIVSDDFGKDRYSDRVKLMNIKDADTLSIEPHPYNLADLQDKWDSLAAEIRKYGVQIA